MSITGPMILPADLLIMQASEVTEETRLQCACGAKDFIVTRPRSRSQSRTVNGQVAELLESFRQPTTIVSAVLSLSATHGTNPERTLEQAFVALAPFIRARWLVPADSSDAQRIEPCLQSGDTVGGYEVIDCRHLLEDTELYLARTANHQFAALKIARRGAPAGLERTFAHEARILTHLDGVGAPRLFTTGRIEGQPYLAMSWCAGVGALEAAIELRQLHGTGSRRRVLDLCRAILDAYAGLHARGVIHGDVNTKNVLIDKEGRVHIIDFGFARLVGQVDDVVVPRLGVPEFFEPELAAAARLRGPTPIASVAGEQYALAVLLYLLICGKHYLAFSGERDEMLRQVVEGRPITFAERDIPAWPELEAVLLRALDKNPDLRFPTVAAFGDALGAALPSGLVMPAANHYRRHREAYEELIMRLDAEDIVNFPLPVEIPQCSITYGAAGVGYALYCLACARGDASLFSTADAWAVRAIRIADEPRAFTNEQWDLGGRGTIDASVYYGRSGIFLVQALVAQAMGNEATFSEAVADYVRTCQTLEDCLDLTFGQAGVLVGCGLLLDASGPNAVQRFAGPLGALMEVGRSAFRTIADALDRHNVQQADYLGVAHGLAGLCYAALFWSDVSGDAVPVQLPNQLESLAAIAEVHGRGVRWPCRAGKNRFSHDAHYMDGWCHGASGYVHLWTAAFRVFGDARYLQIAERAAWAAWEAPSSIGGLCCGDPGRAYALLNLFRHTGDREWVVRAEALANRSVDICMRDLQLTYSLFKGALGVAVLLEDLHAPERASFPLFEREMRAAPPPM
jgi:serine/threonine-protein kinase